MDEEFTFFYPVINDVQLDFDGHRIHKDVLLEGHIYHGGRILCGQSKEVLKNQVKVKFEKQTVKEKMLKVRDPKAKLCLECLRLYKKNGHSALQAWIEGKPKIPRVSVAKPLK
jgi:hypothetical protein